MKRGGNTGSEQGSVLMEFILVAPLYLCLFGAMFLTGELLLGRSRLWNNDRFLAWLARDRFIPASELTPFHEALRVEAKKQFFLLTDKDEEAGWDFPETWIGPLDWVGRMPSFEESADDPSQQGEVYVMSNRWLISYRSQMQLRMSAVPAWIRGPLMLGHLFSREPSPFEDAVFDFYRGGKSLDDRDNDRHYVMKRIDDTERFQSPETLVREEIVWKVASDPWPSKASTDLKSTQSRTPYPPGTKLDYTRFFLQLGE